MKRFVVLSLLLLPSVARANPEDMGPGSVTVWDAGTLSMNGIDLPTLVYIPDASPPGPLVAVLHGLIRNRTYHDVLARNLASRGAVVLVPTWPCQLWGCDQSAMADATSDLLDWAEAQGAAGGSALSGKVDGDRRGLVGHSAGGMAVFLAAARDVRIDVVVGYDPVDAGAAQGEVPSIVAPSLTLAAADPGLCSSGWKDVVYPVTGTAMAKAKAVVAGSGHCDPEDPTDSICDAGCFTPTNRATTTYYRRYAVAFTTCLLGLDEAMATWLGGSGWQGDVGAGALEEPDVSGTFVCPATSGDDDDTGDDDTSGDDDAGDDDSGDDDVGDDDSGDDDVGDDDAGDDDAGDDDSAGPGDVSSPYGCVCATGARTSGIVLVPLIGLRRRR
jgi:dienelactone hydrolase